MDQSRIHSTSSSPQETSDLPSRWAVAQRSMVTCSDEYIESRHTPESSCDDWNTNIRTEGKAIKTTTAPRKTISTTLFHYH